MECETFLNLSDDFRNICPTSSYMNLPFLSNSLLAKHPLNMNCWTSLRFNFMVEKFKHFGQVRNTPGAWALENDRNDEDLGDKQLIYFGSLSFSTLVICIFRIPSSDSLWVFRVSESKTLLLKFLFIPGFFWAGLMPNLIADQQIGDKVWEAMKISCATQVNLRMTVYDNTHNFEDLMYV